ncbi:MAG TPA: hypothetical protein PK680_09735 [Novosphingobium sp.]|nr:hypothetical protein [Novosphingobium sp.]
MVTRSALLLPALILSACSPSKLAYGTVKSAMMEGGLSEPNAACMAERMTDRLSLMQLNKLRKLKGEKRSLAEYVEAVRKVGDAEALSVTASSAALCTLGLAKEKKQKGVHAETRRRKERRREAAQSAKRPLPFRLCGKTHAGSDKAASPQARHLRGPLFFSAASA